MNTHTLNVDGLSPKQSSMILTAVQLRKESAEENQDTRDAKAWGKVFDTLKGQSAKKVAVVPRWKLEVKAHTLGTYYPSGNKSPIPCVVLEERDSGRMEILDLLSVKTSTNGPSILTSFTRRVVAKKSITRAIDWFSEDMDASIKLLCGLGFMDTQR